ncbi:MAG: sensor histidine kinase [Planctomycetota bacterium]|jgi:heavy metal sensor kinase
MLSSLRFRLIAWFGLLLAGALLLFGTLLYEAQAKATWSGIDAELESQARAVIGAMEYDADEADLPADPSDPHRLERGWELDLSREFRGRITRAGGFAIFVGAGGAVLHFEGHGGVEAPAFVVTGDGPGPQPADRRESRAQGTVDGQAVQVAVWRDVEEEREALVKLRTNLILLGLGVVVAGLLGAFFIARLSVKPIEAAAAEAAAIEESDLGKRLSTDAVPQELQGVVTAFNGTLDRLQAAFERQAQFTADASHELRTPVAIIRTQAEAALKRDRSAEDYKASLEACARAAVRMTAIVEGLLTLARADAGDGVSLAACDLKAVTEEHVAPLAEQAAADGITVKCDAAPATVSGDEGLLGEVVTNLVTNAIRYNKPGGTVDVSLSVPNGTVELQVRDTGSGIPAASLPHLFERFYRVDPARSREEGGSGLGLAITKWIVEAHKGAIEVESTEGEGTTFTVRLPAPTTRP